MACIDRVPKCGFGSGSDPLADPLKKFAAILGLIGGIVGVLGGLGVLKDIAAALGGASAAGALAGLIAFLAVILLISLYGFNRCYIAEGLPQCIAGCVSNVRESFSETWETLLPFAALPPRVDVTVKSFFWDFVELNNAYVYCTSDAYPHMSEIMHCYYYSDRVCNGAFGALVGASAAGIAGIIAGAAIAAAIGCATVILCIIALIVAAIIVVAAALAGAFIGGNVAAAEGELPPADASGHTVATGMLVTLNGIMVQLEEDNKANCLWWVHSTQIHGTITAGTHQPFSYCDIDEQLTMDACARAGDGGPIL
jgi:hypothetical protein